jgi:alginate O-acetyltransferase complex protein AlgI
MMLSSLSYLVFVPVVYLLFDLAPERRRWLVLLVASYAFYASLQAPYLLAVLVIATGTSYACARQIAAQPDEAGRTRWLWGGTIACVGMLALLRCLPFLQSPAAGDSPLVTVGVSYFTFQAVSYLADVYLGTAVPEESLGRYALYLSFFPKMLQGPIERANDLLPQLKRLHPFNYDAARSAMLLFTWGLFKKVAVADRLAIPVNVVYADGSSYQGLPLILATYFYAMQIYCDFSGYTDMARGSARLFGIELSENFRNPYAATSIAEFWRRWHISFSRWLLDYLFRPLQMAWRGSGRLCTPLAIVATFLISGIWHGVGWGFLIWGLLHGLYLATSSQYRPYQKRVHRLPGWPKGRWLTMWQVVVTFNLVCLSWVFFRAESLADALHVVTNLHRGFGDLLANLHDPGVLRKNLMLKNGIGDLNLAICLVLIAVVALSETKMAKRVCSSLCSSTLFVRWSCYLGAVFIVLLLGKFRNAPFIYSRF